MKDFYDIWLLSRRFDFDGPVLATAVSRTFGNRKTPIVPLPLALTSAFAADAGKQTQWRAFVRKSRLEDAPAELQQVVDMLGAFLLPVAEAVHGGEAFERAWPAPGPWQER
jgi:hypothetical protein